MSDLLLRFFIGGLMVSLFAVIGDVLKPKTFAGLFAAAPSIALATLILTISKRGGAYAAIEGRSMIIGAIGFLCYSQVVALLLMRYRWRALQATCLSLLIWLAVSGIGCWVLVRAS